MAGNNFQYTLLSACFNPIQRQDIDFYEDNSFSVFFKFLQHTSCCATGGCQTLAFIKVFPCILLGGWHSWTTSMKCLNSSHVQGWLKQAPKMLDALQPSCYSIYQTPACNDSMMWLATDLCYTPTKSKLLLIIQILSGNYNLCKFLHLLL